MFHRLAIANLMIVLAVGAAGLRNADAADKVGVAGYENYADGYLHVLQEGGAAVESLKEEALADVAGLANCKLVVVATGVGNNTGLSEQMREALLCYTLNGGRLLLDHCAINGFSELPFRGVSFEFVKDFEMTDADTPLAQSYSPGTKFTCNSYATVTSPPTTPRAKVLATASGKPALVSTPYGWGIIYFSAVPLGFVIDRDPKTRALIQTLLHLTETTPTQPEDAARVDIAKFTESAQAQWSARVEVLQSEVKLFCPTAEDSVESLREHLRRWAEAGAGLLRGGGSMQEWQPLLNRVRSRSVDLEAQVVAQLEQQKERPLLVFTDRPREGRISAAYSSVPIPSSIPVSRSK